MDILKIRLMLRLVCPVLSIYFLLTNTGGEGYVELFAEIYCPECEILCHVKKQKFYNTVHRNPNPVRTVTQ